MLKKKKHLKRPQTKPNIFICLLDHADEVPFANIEKEGIKAASKTFSTREVWNQYVAMVTKLVYSYCGAHVVESYCKESSISDAN